MFRVIDRYRKKIDVIDSKLYSLLKERLALVKKLGVLKKEAGFKMRDSKREAQVLKRISNPHVREIFKKIMQVSLRIQK